MAAYSTACGHSFCHACIVRHLRRRPDCPVCEVAICETALLPNRRLERQIKKFKQALDTSPLSDGLSDDADILGDKRDGEYCQFLRLLLDIKKGRLELLQRSIADIQGQLGHERDAVIKAADISTRTATTANSAMGSANELGELYDRCLIENRARSHFKRLFGKLSRRHTLRPINTVMFGDPFSPSNILSSIEYNGEQRVFAVSSSSSRQIRLYDYDTFSRPFPSSPLAAQITVPIAQIPTSSKVASLAWDPFSATSSLFAAADYEGSIKIFDVEAENVSMSLDEHRRRIWSIDYSRTAPNTLLSGSDDSRVKHWSVLSRASTFTLDARANVCSVRFCPDSTQFAFGTSDHVVHVHDIRSPHRPVYRLCGHQKAVSYVRWLGKSIVLSASTDNTIRQWRDQQCVRIHRGHIHEKKFVGLAADPTGEWFACGSETNRLCLYSAHLDSPLCDIALGTVNLLNGEMIESEGFASCVAWVSEDELLVGNNLGMISAVHVCRE